MITTRILIQTDCYGIWRPTSRLTFGEKATDMDCLGEVGSEAAKAGVVVPLLRGVFERLLGSRWR